MGSRVWWIFHLLVGYVILQFAWWAFLIFDLNSTIFLKEQDIIQLEIQLVGEPARNVELLDAELTKRIWMVVGEGTVFFLLLMIGIVYLHRAIGKEMALARQQRNFLMSITHELNSPLASIKLALETIDQRDLPPDKMKKLVTQALNETGRLGALVDNLLLATRIENSTFQFHRENADLSAFVERFMESTAQPYRRSHQLEANIEPGIELSIDRLAFASILSNLLDNAAKYSPKGTTIALKLTQSNGEIELTVSDEGEGIPAEEHNQIFRKFYRVGNEETRQTKGTGLGLYLTQHFTERHGGNIRVKSNQPKGAIFALRFKPNS